MFELEIKLAVKDFETAYSALIDAGVVFAERISQYDSIFAASPETITKPRPGTVVARVRQQGSKSLLNVKRHLTNELDCEEHEFSVSDEAEAKAFLQILGLQQVVEVKKDRLKGKLGDKTVCLDSVHGLGSFVEFELISNEQPRAGEQDALLVEARSALGPAVVDRVSMGYDRMILEATSE
ncbi:class IV adenylate cyclase [Actinomycetospora callitridis]|uniref:class IV adenylate cyclase n=1 Tax=Actinomycetospora callitridis TaxID=913944 RepID=UPI002365382B|nr:CYTH domain-containing protein [Actinomycetospora callitridis]MDD7917987.1 CYTH domain-containing protein [Actinomycetospora callitridis]